MQIVETLTVQFIPSSVPFRWTQTSSLSRYPRPALAYAKKGKVQSRTGHEEVEVQLYFFFNLGATWV
jgi:hypothetical protein